MDSILTSKEAKDHLFELRIFAESIVETANYPLVILSKNFTITSASHSFYQFFQTSKMQAQGKDIFKIWNNSDLKELLQKKMLKCDSLHNFELIDDFKEQGKKNFTLKARKIFWFKDYTEMILLAIEDVTEKKAIEQRKNDFISMASHDLRIPVTIIKAYAQLLEMESNSISQSIRKSLSKISKETDKLSHLLSTLLNLSQLQTGHLELNFETFNLTSLINEIIEDFKLIQNTHTILFQNKINSIISADKIRITQALTNLINNAIKYSPSANMIYINMFRDEKEHTILVSIRDLGVGIAPEEKDQLFKRFSRTNLGKDSSIQGVGLGLYITAEIIHLHKGIIGYKSDENKGTEFYFTLPEKDTKLTLIKK